MKNLLLPFFIAVLILINACSENKNPEAPRIGLLMDNYIQDRWVKDRDVFVNRAKELGATVMVDAAKGDEQLQIKQAENMLKKGADVLVIVPVNLETAAEIIKLAHASSAKVLSYDRLIKKCNLDFYVSFDNVRVGELQAEYFVKRIPKGNYVLIGGPTSDNNSVLIRIGQLNILQPLMEKGDIKIVYDVYVEKWEEAQAYQQMKKCLKEKGKDIQVVLCANDELARGAIKAIEENKLTGKILVAGQDAEKDALERIADGKQTITIYKPIEAIAITAAQIAVKMATEDKLDNISFVTINNDFKMVPSILLNPMIVNKETIKMTIPTDNYIKENKVIEQ